MTVVLPLTLITVVLILSRNAFAGPPYITDDPEPVEYQHWEVYFASIFVKQPDAWTSTAPHLGVNYGPIPNVQLHIIAPLTLYVPSQGPSGYGYGVTELGIKFRFVQESDWLPQIGIFCCWKCPLDPREILEVGTCRHTCRYGCRRARATGLLMEEAVIG